MEKWCLKLGFKLRSRVKMPLSATYRPDLGVSELLSLDSINWYQSALGVLRWVVELERVGIDTETSMLKCKKSIPVQIVAWVESNHAGEKLIRRSRTGYMIV